MKPTTTALIFCTIMIAIICNNSFAQTTESQGVILSVERTNVYLDLGYGSVSEGMILKIPKKDENGYFLHPETGQRILRESGTIAHIQIIDVKSEYSIGIVHPERAISELVPGMKAQRAEITLEELNSLYTATNYDGVRGTLDNRQKNNFPMSNNQNINYETEILHIRTCLMKYRKEYLTGYWLVVGGGLLYGSSPLLYGLDAIDGPLAEVLLITGLAMAITGEIVKLTSNRWLKKAYIGPTRSGVGISLSF